MLEPTVLGRSFFHPVGSTMLGERLKRAGVTDLAAVAGANRCSVEGCPLNEVHAANR
ncbi:MAG: hypothetical protein HYY93_01505 [Planctomycetes bacterium]|nr:hypothetical protein [Planctomycetota bacterium]